MTDDRSKASVAQDRVRISLTQEHEVRYWTKKWDITREELEAAVKAAGPMAAKVAAHLGKPA